MEKNKISVIVPVYNVEKYLDRCIESIVSQTYKNLEIILVDDGSPDSCPQMCEFWAEKDNRIKVVHKENGGLSDARNAGMAVATGEYISFIDSDDWIEKDMLMKLYDCMQSDNSEIASCGVRWITDDGEVINNATVTDDTVLDTENAISELLEDGKLKQHVWNKLYKFDLIKDILFEKGKYHEDVFWSYQVLGRANRVSIIKDSFYNYVQRDSSIMGAGYSSKRLDALDAAEQRCDYIKCTFPNLYNLALYDYVGSCMFHLQSAIKANCENSIRDNIIQRIPIYKTGNIYEVIDGKQRIWMKMFCKCPAFTCKLRNLLGIGM